MENCLIGMVIKNENTGEYDTSKTSNKYQIPKYTYEFDLTGSSKALNH